MCSNLPKKLSGSVLVGNEFCPKLVILFATTSSFSIEALRVYFRYISLICHIVKILNVAKFEEKSGSQNSGNYFKLPFPFHVQRFCWGYRIFMEMIETIPNPRKHRSSSTSLLEPNIKSVKHLLACC